MGGDQQERVQGRYWLLYAALPAAVAVAAFGSMSLVIQQTTLQRVIPGAALGRVSAVFLTGGAAATLIGSVAGPFLAQAASLTAAATAASLVTLGAAALARFAVPPMPARPPRPAATGTGRCHPRAVASDRGAAELTGRDLG